MPVTHTSHNSARKWVTNSFWVTNLFSETKTSSAPVLPCQQHTWVMNSICRLVTNSFSETEISAAPDLLHRSLLRVYRTLFGMYRDFIVDDTGWWRYIGCLKLQKSSRKRATNQRSLLRVYRALFGMHRDFNRARYRVVKIHRMLSVASLFPQKSH